jgi:hypothetical protein
MKTFKKILLVLGIYLCLLICFGIAEWIETLSRIRWDYSFMATVGILYFVSLDLIFNER